MTVSAGEFGVQTLWEDEDLALRRHARVGAPPVLVLAPASVPPSPGVEARLRRSHAVGVALDPSWAVMPRTLETRDGRLTLLLDDPGGDLLVRRVGRPGTIAELLLLVLGLAGSVRKMHECGLVHRDIRPSNLFVDADSREVRLTGFGISSRLPPFDGADLSPDSLAGSAAYAAPEQSGRSNRAVDARSDLYALGVTLYELAGGALPFTAKTADEWTYAHVAGVPSPLDDGPRAIPIHFAALILKLLARSPVERYQTAAALEADLRACLAQWEAHGRIDPFLLAARDAPQRRIDVTERLRADEATALQLANDRVQLALRGSNVGIWDFSLHDGGLEGATCHLVNIWESLGYARGAEPSDDFMAHPERWHAADLLEMRRAMDAHLRGETPDFALVARNIHEDGTHRWRIHRGKVLRDGHNKAIRFIGTSVDITDRKHLEEQLVQAKELAEGANLAKDDFLANVSHEIRTPMNAIFGMTELMLEDPLTETQRSRLAIAKSAADNLLVIIDDLLDFSKIEAGMVDLELSEFSLRAAVNESVETLAGRALQKGLALHSEVDAAVPDLAIGDAGRVRQVLINLLGNAVKFTVRGQVILRVTVAESTAQRIAVRFAVLDTGIGIREDKQAAIFQAFAQQDTSTTRTYGGTGLGLTIAARLASAMDGGISVESTPGCGSLFTFMASFARRSEKDPVLPAPGNSRPMVDEPGGAKPRRVRILVAEDNEFNAELMLQQIGRRGHDAIVVGRGDEVLGRIEEGAVDLLLLDLHLPGLDGFQVIEQIRARERITGGYLPVIALTARSRAIDRRRCLDAGMDDFISKPAKATVLWALVERLLGATLPVSAKPAPSAGPAWLEASVLLGACGGNPAALAPIEAGHDGSKGPDASARLDAPPDDASSEDQA